MRVASRGDAQPRAPVRSRTIALRELAPRFEQTWPLRGVSGVITRSPPSIHVSSHELGLGVSRGLEMLREVDDVHVQAELALAP